MIKATKKFVLATLLLAGFGSAAIADTKEEPAASASFSAYREVKEYAEKYVCEKPTDETANQCAIAENATRSSTVPPPSCVGVNVAPPVVRAAVGTMKRPR